MNNQILENAIMKLCSKCGIVKIKTISFLETPIKNIEVNVYNIVVSNRRNGEIKVMTKLKIIKKYSEDNREKIRSLQKKCYDENRDVIIKKRIEYEKKDLTRI